MLNLASFLKREPCGQAVLQDRSILKGQKLLEMPKLKNSNETFLVIFKQCEDILIRYRKTYNACICFRNDIAQKTREFEEMIRREGALLQEIRENQRKLDTLDAKLRELKKRKK